MFFLKKPDTKGIIIKELIYFLIFVLIGIVIPYFTSLFGLGEKTGTIFKALFKLRFDALILILLPYLIFVLVRILQRLDAKSWLENIFGKRETESMWLVLVLIFRFVILIMVIAMLAYILYPKSMYIQYNGGELECRCFGYEQKLRKNETMFGPKSSLWGVCFGVLYDCEDKIKEYSK